MKKVVKKPAKKVVKKAKMGPKAPKGMNPKGIPESKMAPPFEEIPSKKKKKVRKSETMDEFKARRDSETKGRG